MKVGVFTDTYMPTINGVSYTVSKWKEIFESQENSMQVYYPNSEDYNSDGSETGIRSVQFPFYESYRVALPTTRIQEEFDLLHCHTPFSMGILAHLKSMFSSVPLVASLHTSIPEYTCYLPYTGGTTSKLADIYQSRFYDRADRVVVPTEHVKKEIQAKISTDIRVVSNGVDISMFRPTESFKLRKELDIPVDKTIVGYCGRHGHEKNIQLILDCFSDSDFTIVLGGDGPARKRLMSYASNCNVDVRFPGFVDRERLREMYSLFDVFIHPSPVETQGIVAMESICCGTPVVAINKGALSETVDDGVTGRVVDDKNGIASATLDILENSKYYRSNCIDKRECYSVESSIEKIEELYSELTAST